ncbi:MAG: hypothetical protein JWN76_3500 [Chitinophagaceae bacterium]|nr:hypothetical protein [Chitinophagaceae bacterium]
MKKLPKFFAKLYNAAYTQYDLKNELDIQKVLTAQLLIEKNKERSAFIIQDLHAAEFRVFSQWGDDGIIQFLVNHLDITNKVFIEFGVEDYREATTRFLLINDNWKGLVMDASSKNINVLKSEDIYWRQDITAVPAFITAENINALITENGFTGDIGLLHIDIDGNDYWIWKAIDCINPVIVIVEYNHLFGASESWTMCYSDTTAGAASGASVAALCGLAEEKGYAFIGCESHGVNAYFVRKDKVKDLEILTAATGYIEARAKGNYTKEQLPGKNVYDTSAGKIITIVKP